MHSTQIKVEAEVQEKAILVVIHDVRTNNNNRRTSPMKEDVITLEVGRAKEDIVHGKGTSR